MKKSSKKLALSRETLQSLSESVLPKVVGRDTGVSGCLECPPVSDWPC